MMLAPNPEQGSPSARLKLGWKRALEIKRLQLPGRRSRQERVLFRRLRRLGLCGNGVSIEPILGGLSNHNYAVRTDGRSYFVRVSQDQPP